MRFGGEAGGEGASIISLADRSGPRSSEFSRRSGASDLNSALQCGILNPALPLTSLWIYCNFWLLSCSIIFWHPRMSKDWLHSEVLKAVFPLLDGKDLASCMLVCRQWREIAGEDYFWKCICVKRWPSICKRPLPVRSYYRFFLTFSRPQRPQPLLPPRLSFNDLEFYIDIWSEQKLIFSEAISGCVLQTGIKNPPPGIPDILKLHLDGPNYKMVVPVEPRLTVALGSKITVSVLASRKDTNQVACILRDSVFDYVDGCASRALAYAYLNFSPRHPFISEIRAWVSLLFMADGNDNAIDVFGIEIDFVDAASKEHEVLWLLDMLDWK